ncbi:unnamed protein product [Clonostachys solani]|uniref:Cell wall protein PhiA n=1 Tax=Clonostachys solani TaxID=160281 RepID=A0A9N9Z8D9_9HYPO|nr:unnamed protein product [Clonostachys solani]
MKFDILAVALATASTALAVPAPWEAFKLRAVSDSNAQLNGQFLKAKTGRYYFGPAPSNPVCEGGNQDDGTFYLKDGSVFFYNTSPSVTPQQMFTDRSGMGMGVTGYGDQGSPLPRYAEVTGWAFNSQSRLNIYGNEWYACPHPATNSWSIWVYSPNPNPGHNQGCIKISLERVGAPNPLSCTYSK